MDDPRPQPVESAEPSEPVARLVRAIEQGGVWDEHVETIALDAARSLLGAGTCERHTVQALCRVGLSAKGARALVSQAQETHAEQAQHPDWNARYARMECAGCTSYVDGPHEVPQTPTRWGFNWAALLITPIWLLGHRFWVWAGIYIVGMVLLTVAEVRIVKSVMHIAFAVWIAMTGNRMLWGTGRYKTVEELRRSERAWAIFALVSSALLCVLLLLLIASIQ